KQVPPSRFFWLDTHIFLSMETHQKSNMYHKLFKSRDQEEGTARWEMADSRIASRVSVFAY
ncbi:MAG: hypothetical protein DPW11_03260, partial [bacterium]